MFKTTILITLIVQLPRVLKKRFFFLSFFLSFFLFYISIYGMQVTTNAHNAALCLARAATMAEVLYT